MSFEHINDLHAVGPVSKEDDIVLVVYASHIRAKLWPCPTQLAAKRRQGLALRDQLADESLANPDRAAAIANIGCNSSEIVQRLVSE